MFSGIAGQLADRYDKALVLKIVKAAEILIMGLAGLGFALHDITILLAALFMMGTRVTDQGLEQLCQSKRWTYLRLNNTQVTDAGLQHLAGLHKLTNLGLYKTQITDAGLKHLQSLKSLKSLQVGGSKVTDTGIADLKAALPKLKFER